MDGTLEHRDNQAVKEGENLLEIKVVNLWPNRLIGDEQILPMASPQEVA